MRSRLEHGYPGGDWILWLPLLSKKASMARLFSSWTALTLPALTSTLGLGKKSQRRLVSALSTSFNHSSTTLQPLFNHSSTTLQPFFKYSSITPQSLLNHSSITPQSLFNHFQSLFNHSSATLQPLFNHSWHSTITLQPLFNHCSITL